MDLSVFITGFLISTLGFVIYYFLISNAFLTKLFVQTHKKDSNLRQVLFARMAGVVIFGLLPSILILVFSGIQFKDVGLWIERPQRQSLWIVLIATVIIFINYFNGKKEDNLMMYPQIRKAEWSISLVILSAISWIMYLFAYEFLFRGILLFSSYEIFGYWPAIFINIGIYSLVHVHKGAKEALGAVPMGLILSVLVLSTGTIWIAFFVHIVLALTNEWFSLYFHPEMRLRR